MPRAGAMLTPSGRRFWSSESAATRACELLPSTWQLSRLDRSLLDSQCPCKRLYGQHLPTVTAHNVTLYAGAPNRPYGGEGGSRPRIVGSWAIAAEDVIKHRGAVHKKFANSIAGSAGGAPPVRSELTAGSVCTGWRGRD